MMDLMCACPGLLVWAEVLVVGEEDWEACHRPATQEDGLCDPCGGRGSLPSCKEQGLRERSMWNDEPADDAMKPAEGT